VSAIKTPAWLGALLLGIGVASSFRVASPVDWTVERLSGAAFHAVPAAGGLTMPVEGVGSRALTPSFDDARSGGRVHHAIDILARRGTRVLATAEGRVVEVARQGNAGLMVEQIDRRRGLCYTYAHLDAIAPGIAAGSLVRAGQPIGFVGTSGNAPRSTPHLHFAVSAVAEGAMRADAAAPRGAGCGGGAALDPYALLTGQ
jgi:murein DD-endopeptidase MepM/ murein hydrolase activator NlpD